MEPRKYSTGTKGRLKMHSDKCKAFVHANTSFSLAAEFIESVDPGHDDQVWQRFQNPGDIGPELQAWLGGSVEKAAAPGSTPILRHPEIKSGSQLKRETEKIDAALQKTRAWLASAAVQAELSTMTPTNAAEAALRKLYLEITGTE